MQENILTKHLIMSASSSDILQKLLQTLGFESIYDRDTRGKAARIVANIAGGIRLEKFPGGVRHIFSLLDTFQIYSLIEPYKANWLADTFETDWFKVARYLDDNDDREESGGDLLNTYKELVVQGLRILRKLAANFDNCKVMLDNPYLLPKIMAPVTSDLLHNIDHGVWSDIVEASLRVMAQLTAAQGQTGNKLRSGILSNNEAIKTMERILECDNCNEKLQKEVIAILTDLYVDISSNLETASREQFIETLVRIMTDDNKDKEARRVTAANAHVILSSKVETSAIVIMKSNDNVVDNLTTMVVQSHPCRLMAVQILKHICMYTDDDECLNKLRKAMTAAIMKMLKNILFWATEEKHTRTEVGQISLTKPETDIENQCGDSQDNGQGNNLSTSHQRAHKLSEYAVICFLSLYATVCDKMINADQDMARQFDATTLRDGAVSLPVMLKPIVEKCMHPRPSCLEIVKLTCEMTISMIKYRGSYVKEDLDNLMDALSSASNEMFLLDGSMVFGVTYDGATTWKPFRSLVSLLKEAKELVDKHYGLSS